MPDGSWGSMVTPMEITEHVTFNIKYEKKHSLVPKILSFNPVLYIQISVEEASAQR